MARPRHMSDGNEKDEAPKLKFTKENIKESLVIFRYIKPYRRQFISGLVVIALSALTTMAFPKLLQELIDTVNPDKSAGGMKLPMGDFNIVGHLPLTSGQIALAMVALLCVQMIVSYLRVYFLTYVGEHSVADMRKHVYSKMITMNMDFFAKRRVGELSSRILSDITQIQDTISTILPEILRGILTLVIGMTLIFVMSHKLGLLMLSVVPVIVLIAILFSKAIKKYSRTAQDQLADTGTILQESLQGINNVKSFTNEWYEIRRYNHSINQLVKTTIQTGRFRGLFIATMLFTLFGTIVLLVWYSTGLMEAGELTFGNLTAFVVYTVFVGGTMGGFADMFSQLQKTMGATQRVRELLKEESEDITLKDIEVKSQYKLSGNVRFEHVAFTYQSRKDNPVLKDISLEAASGQQIAIVGPSGAGKSTLISLLLHYYTADSGRILFDDKDIRDIPLTQLRKQMALVPQDVLLFGGTIRENIAYGKPSASEEEIEEAARKANAHKFISGFPEKYDTVVGERGVKLSGGQRQRIAIARAILKDPAILILDEATSSLDSESEQQVQEALYNLMKNRTSFVIAHRLSTIRSADKIIVLEGGYVKEQGTHSQLLDIQDGLYKNLNRLQVEL
ncbi:MAG: ATP-binding cassette domain-containing protein [Flavipsychrobacter sp.]|nr:ATP-binding cassette domain-containing protein [Flavipsychrobacter sp.]